MEYVEYVLCRCCVDRKGRRGDGDFGGDDLTEDQMLRGEG